MHELSIADALITQCERLAKEHGASAVDSVEVEIGRLSGVEAHYLQSAFEAWREGTICAQAELIVRTGEVEAQCRACGESSTLAEFEFVCKRCGGNDLRVTRGEDLLLLRVGMV